MPKERRERVSRPSPYRAGCSSSSSSSSSNRTTTRHSTSSTVVTPLEAKEYDEARCPVCMDHPHNAVLLQCESSRNGCRAFMCDTSYRHSNCLDQFRRSNDGSNNTISGEESGKLLLCPLCRGSVNGWRVVESARGYMNLKSRNCSSESCEFTGTYGELRKHAREMHPDVRPSHADPERVRDWRRMERERDIGDLFSVLGEEEDGVAGGGGGRRYISFPPFAIFLIVHVLGDNGMTVASTIGGGGNRSSRSRRSSSRSSQSGRRRVLWGENVDGIGEEDRRDDDDREEDDDDGDGGSDDTQRHWGRRRPRQRRRLRMTQSDDDEYVP